MEPDLEAVLIQLHQQMMQIDTHIAAVHDHLTLAHDSLRLWLIGGMTAFLVMSGTMAWSVWRMATAIEHLAWR